MSEKAKVRAGCYCRISSDPRDKREGVDRQREDTAVLCEVKGWTVADVYVDNDRSASNGKGRPEWDRLLADVKAGKIDAVAAWDQDRVNRMMEDFVAYKRLFVERGILLATSNNGDIDLSTPSGVLTATIKTAVSEHEVAMMRIRQRRAGRQRADKGRPKWRKAFGYLPYTGSKEADKGERHADPVTGPLVAQGYAALLAGVSISQIARDWNAAGAIPASGTPWTASTLSLFLRKPRNAGLRDYHGEILESKGTWTPLVSESTWRAAQAVLTQPERYHRKTVRRHLLTGMMLCGNDCGGTLGGSYTGGGKIIYVCKTPECRGVSVRAELVEPIVKESVAQRLAREDAVDLLKAQLHDAEHAERIRQELASLYGEIEAIGIERGQRLLTGQQAKTATDVVMVEIAKLEALQADQEMLRVFDGIPLGTPEAVDAVANLTPDRFRSVLSVLGTVTVAPVGKGHRPAGGVRFDRDRVLVDFR